jgi:CBS domain containing-hemolysin-like protein
MVVLSPLGYFFSFFKHLANKMFKSKGKETSTDDELLVLVDEAQEIGEFDSEESELIRSAIEFGEQEVVDIFTPRVDVVAVEFGANNSEIAKVFSESGFSRLPVYKESVDNIIGTINAKDFYKKVYHRSTPVDEIICEPFFIPASMKARDLLRELKAHKRHMAIIADEYGGTKGIVTLEDVLEELVGEIFDEHEAPTLDLVEIDENKFLVEGSLDFDEFAEKFQVEFETEMNTLGGFVMETLGKIPEVNDSFEFENLAIKVIETDEKRASKLEITIKDTKKEISES